MMLNSMLLLCLLFSTVKAFPEGAPSTTCETMMPDHGYDAQNSTSPFFTALAQLEIPSDGSISLTISSVDPQLNKTFTGFLVVATAPEEEDRIVGIFKHVSDGQVINCQLADSRTLPDSAATHSDENHKPNVTMEWFPNGFTGDVVFKMTYVQGRKTFWVKDETATIRVLDSETTPVEVTDPTPVSTPTDGVARLVTPAWAVSTTFLLMILSIFFGGHNYL